MAEREATFQGYLMQERASNDELRVRLAHARMQMRVVVPLSSVRSVPTQMWCRP